MRGGVRKLYSEQAVQSGTTTDQADLTLASIPYAVMPDLHRPEFEKYQQMDADLYAGLERAGFKCDFGEDGSGLYMKYLRRGSGYYIDVGASQLVIDGEIKVKSGVEVERINRDSLTLSDGTTLEADLIVFATGYGPMTDWAEKLISPEVADAVGKCWGLGSDTTYDPGPWEGELRNMWKPVNHPALWFHGGNLQQSRHYSLYLALQLKARYEGIATPVYGLPEVHQFTGFASSFAVCMQGLRSVGASDAEVATALAALSIAMGLPAILLSTMSRIPVSIAWSTPGAALLVTTGAVSGGFSSAVGAFILCGVALTLAGLWRPLGRAVSAIPAPIANGMLAGVLVNLCFAPFKAIAFDPWLGLPIVAAWAIAGAFNRLLAVPGALIAFAVVLVLGVDIPAGAVAEVLSQPLVTVAVTTPTLSLEAVVNIAIPLFIVTMASQNIPGLAVLKSNGYPQRSRQWLSVTGVFSTLSAFFGGHAVNLAAITAALCAGPDAHEDPAKRYWAAIVAGGVYVLFGLLATLVTSLIALSPTILIQAVAGLALIGAFSNAAVAALESPGAREAAAVTFLFSASSISVFGISGAFWGLLAGLAVLGLKNLRSLGASK